MTGTEKVVEVAGLKVPVWSGGSGPPLLVLHDDIGQSGWSPLKERLARKFTVVAPTHPGYAGADIPEWARHPRDIAALHQWLIRDLKLDRPAVLGFGFGGWVAAEMATLAPRAFRKMVLVGAAGVKPDKGEIFDQFLVHGVDYVRAGFHDMAKFNALFGAQPDIDRLEAWEISREMTTRVAWKPYMFSHALPPLLRGCDIPTLVVWGKEDRIVPLECGEAYARLLRDARLDVIPACGHLVGLEQPDRLAALVEGFL